MMDLIEGGVFFSGEVCWTRANRICELFGVF